MQATPPPRSTNANTWVIVIALMALVLVILVGFGSYAAGRVNSVATTDPKPIKGFGRPQIVRQIDEYWARYELADLGMEIDLATEPIPSYPDWEFESRMVTEAWSFYVIRSGSLAADISAFQFRYGAGRTLDEAAQAFIEVYDGSFTIVEKGKKRSMTLAGKKALSQRLVYEEEGKPTIAEAIHYQDEKWVGSLRFCFYKSEEKEVRKEIGRMLKSIKFSP